MHGFRVGGHDDYNEECGDDGRCNPAILGNEKFYLPISVVSNQLTHLSAISPYEPNREAEHPRTPRCTGSQRHPDDKTSRQKQPEPTERGFRHFRCRARPQRRSENRVDLNLDQKVRSRESGDRDHCGGRPNFAKDLAVHSTDRIEVGNVGEVDARAHNGDREVTPGTRGPRLMLQLNPRALSRISAT